MSTGAPYHGGRLDRGPRLGDSRAMLLDAAGSVVGLTERAIKLVRELKELAGGDGAVSDEVLRLALLETEYNLALLDVVKPQKGVPSDDGRLFAFADRMRLDAISALLLEWRPVEAPRRDWRDGLGLRAAWERIADAFDADDDKHLLAVARFIVVRGQALRALGEIDPAVRKKLHVRTRLENLRDANRVLREALRSRDVLEFLTHSRVGRR